MKLTNMLGTARDYISKAVATVAVVGMLAGGGCAGTQRNVSEIESRVSSDVIYVTESDRGDKTFFGDFSHYSHLLADVTRKIASEGLKDTLEEFADAVEEQTPKYLELMTAENLDLNYAILGDYGNYHLLLGFNNQGNITHLEMFTWEGKQYFEVYRDHPTVSASAVELTNPSATYVTASRRGWEDFRPSEDLDTVLQSVETALRTDLQRMGQANRRTPLPFSFVENDPAQLAREREPYKTDYNAEPGTKAIQAADRELRLAELIQQLVDKTGVDRDSVLCLSGARAALYEMAFVKAVNKHLGISKRRLPEGVRRISKELLHGVSPNRFARVMAVRREFTDGRVQKQIFDFGEPKFTHMYGAYNQECGVTQFDEVKEIIGGAKK